MIYELWESEDGTEASFTSVESYANCPSLKVDGDGKEMVKKWEVEADSWNDAMTKYHEHMGWEPYVPKEI